MAVTPDVIKPMVGTVGFERKASLGNYESATASIYVQFEIDNEDEANTMVNIKDAFVYAKTAVLDQLGVPYEYKEGFVTEMVKQAFPGTVEVKNNKTGESKPVSRQNTVPAKQASTGSDQNQDIYDFLGNYSGDFQFLVDMHDKANDPNWTPTEKQAASIRKCMAREKKAA